MRPGPLKVLSCGAAEVFGVSVEVAGTDPLAALMNSSTSECLPTMFSSTFILAAGVEERSPPPLEAISAAVELSARTVGQLSPSSGLCLEPQVRIEDRKTCSPAVPTQKCRGGVANQDR